IDLHRNQPVVLALEVLYALELGHALERSIQAIVPAVIRTMQNRCLSAGLGRHGCGVMPAYVVKRAQHAVVAAHGYQRFAGNGGGYKLAGLLDLVDASQHLPGARKNRLPLQFRDALIHIPGLGNGGRFREGRLRVVAGDDFFNAQGPAHVNSPRAAVFPMQACPIQACLLQLFPIPPRAAATPRIALYALLSSREPDWTYGTVRDRVPRSGARLGTGPSSTPESNRSC